MIGGLSHARRSAVLGIVGALVALTLSPATAALRAAQSPQLPLAGSAIPQFIEPLPLLDVSGGRMLTADGTAPLTVRMCEFKAQVLPAGTVPGYTGTWVWGYLPDPTGDSSCADLIAEYGGTDSVLDTYIGPVVLAERGTPTQVTWVNDLGTADTTNVLAYKYGTDQTLHWADPLNGEANDCAHAAMMGGLPSVDCAKNYDGPVPAAVHLHGGEVPPLLDGGPDSWYTSDGEYQGHGYYTKPGTGSAGNAATYVYPNTQEAAPIWFHDHTLGATRLNVFSGLAGAYLIKDPDLDLPAGLAAYGLDRDGELAPTVPLVIQDRTFDTNGQLFLHADSAGGTLWSPNPEHPYWVPEFTGDVIVVNGKAWPFMNVEPKRYRFLFLNGSNARTYEMALTDPVSKNDGPMIHVIATDGGYLDAPVRIDPRAAKPALTKLTMMPGERYEAIVDFAGYEAGAIGPNGAAYSGSWLLKNTAKTPFPAGTAPQGSTTGRVMLFRVGPCTSGQCGTSDTSYDPSTGAALRSGSQRLVRLADPAKGTLSSGVTVQQTRQLTLNEVMGMPQTAIDPVTGVSTAYPGGPLEILVNNTGWSGTDRPDFTEITTGGITTYYSELPNEGETEIWEIVNLTADAHPIHLHLVQFQLINRQKFNVNAYTAAYDAAFPSGAFQPAYGPPLDYGGSAAAGGKLGGNPDVGRLAKNGKPVYLQGPTMPPSANEAGWKDTVIMYPGQVTRIAVRWAPTDLAADTKAADAFFPFDPDGGHGYVWHCHIIDHEDNEMMRPTSVTANVSATRTFIQGRDY